MDWPRQFGLRTLAVLTGALCLLLSSCRQTPVTPSHSTSPRRDINAVLTDHDRQLLAIPGVVGVYVGLLDDQQTLCLKVMLARKNAALERSIPRIIEGYRVVSEVTGEIKPLGPDGKSSDRSH